jgi:low affinity Fe/Cu permease
MLFRYIDFILLPIIFFIIKQIYFKPYDLYLNYNSLNFDVYLLFRSVLGNFYYLLYQLPVSFIGNFLNIESFIILIIIYIILNKYFLNIKDKIIFDQRKKAFFIGFFILFLAIFPYAAVGKIGALYSYSDRFQLLTPLGISILIVSSVFIVNLTKRVTVNIFVLFIIGFSSMHIKVKYDMLVDSFYTLAIEENFKYSKVIKSNSTFIIDNNIKNKLVYNRDLSYYEWNGRLKKIFANDKRLMINKFDELESKKDIVSYKEYNFSNCIYSDPIYLELNIKKDILLFDTFKLLYLELMDKKLFYTHLKELVVINYEKY